MHEVASARATALLQRVTKFLEKRLHSVCSVGSSRSSQPDQCIAPATAEPIISMTYSTVVVGIVRQRKAMSATEQEYAWCRTDVPSPNQRGKVTPMPGLGIRKAETVAQTRKPSRWLGLSSTSILVTV